MAWAEKLGQVGTEKKSQVVVYGSQLSDTARIWWTLKYLVVEHVVVLNGGWDLWVKQNGPRSTAIPKVTATRIEPKFQEDRLEKIGALKQSVRKTQVKVVDARSADEFTGKDVRGKRGGHIAGATHLEW